MGCCGGFSGGGGGGGGNLSGTLTPTYYPIATGAHTLGDGHIREAGGIVLVDVDTQVGGVYISHAGAVSAGQFHATGLTFFDGTSTFGADVDAHLGTVTALHVHATGLSTFDDVVDVGANITLDGPAGQITTEFLDVHSNASIDGTLTLKGDLIINDGVSNVFTVDAATGDAHTAGELTVDLQATFGASTVIPVVDALAAGGAGVYTAPIDAYLSDFFETAPGGAGVTTIGAPTNAAKGRRFMLRIQLAGAAGNTIAFDAIYRFPAGAPTMDFTVTGYYYLGFAYNEHSNTWDAIGTLVGPFL